MEMRDKAIDQGDLAAVVIMTDRIKELVAILVKFQNANYYRRQNMGGDISNEMIRRATQSPILDVVQQHVELKKRGKDYFGKCPFHNEKTASFSVNVEKNIFYCFGCHKGSSVIDFVMKKEGLSFPEAVKRLQ